MLHISYWNFIWWQTYLIVLVNLCFETYVWYKIDMFHISFIISLLFIIVLVPESILCTCFRMKFFFWKFTITCIAMGIEQELSFRIIANSLRYLLWKTWIRVLWILHLVVYFSSEAVLQDLPINNPTENKAMPKFKWHWSMHYLKNIQRRKYFRGQHNKLQNQITNYLIRRKKACKKWQTFLPVINIFVDYFFYRRLILTNKYSYRHIFYKWEHLVFSNWKIP